MTPQQPGPPPARILVTGGTGRLGRALVPRLLGAGHRVRVLTRRERGPADHEQVVGDLRTGAGLAGAVAGTDVIVHLATTNGRGDVPATGRLIGAAAGTAVPPHLVYLSIVGVDAAALGYYRAKRACEQLVEGSGLPWTVVRATQFHDLVAALFDLQRWSPVTLVPAGVRVQPIDFTEVADRLVTVAGEPAAGRVPDLGGPQVAALADLARSHQRAAGRDRPVWPVPVPGRVGRDYRAGIQLVRGAAAGRITFDEFLARRPGR